ncbi:uncharacterized protein [Physcomitrium patens]|uniref:SMP-30/Gluconolactonase/LRE-like region domain-containing protein n=1 Tax=Physcomitrium patens TaxID=3218 RepID=A9SLC6_PHYPA|nr:uncharacterized protein LOC112287095 [Physcomitrium patens]PNR47671.1 hypothetical protein PHYPA_012144 [Physcomitrium patens]|eukprot:XP_024385520.1 uncharacterized protein LOC112287095 [Physcomitrella patens]
MKILGFSLTCVLLVSLEWFAHGVVGERSLRSLKFQASNLFPESFDWDRVRDRFLIGSAAKGTISELASDGSFKEFVRDEEFAGKVAFGGLIVDSRRNRVIVTVQDIVDWNFSGVAAYDLDSGKRLYFARLGGLGVAEGEKACANDVAVDFKPGNVYVTNCRQNFIWKVTKEGTPSVFVKHETFTSQPSISSDVTWCGFNGIVYEPGKHLLAVQTNSGALFRIGVEDQSVHLVSMKDKLPGADGMVLREDGTLVVVSREKVWLVGSASNWMAANVVDVVPLNATDFATAAAIKKGATFVLHAHLGDLYAKQTRDEFEVQEIEFPAEIGDNDPVWLILLILAFVVVVSLWRFQVSYFYDNYRRKRA